MKEILQHPATGNTLLIGLIIFNIVWDLFVAVKSGWL